MFYVIKRSGVTSGKSVADVNKKLNSHFDVDEFNVVGADFVVNVDDTDLEFVRDKQKMENLLFSGFFKKDNSLKYICLCMLIMVAVIFFKVLSLGG